MAQDIASLNTMFDMMNKSYVDKVCGPLVHWVAAYCTVRRNVLYCAFATCCNALRTAL